MLEAVRQMQVEEYRHIVGEDEDCVCVTRSSVCVRNTALWNLGKLGQTWANLGPGSVKLEDHRLGAGAPLGRPADRVMAGSAGGTTTKSRGFGSLSVSRPDHSVQEGTRPPPLSH